MTARDLFGLAVRLVGLSSIIAGLLDGFHVVAVQFGLPVPSHYPVGADEVAAVFYLASGAVVLFGANLIVRVVYGRQH